MSETAGSRHIVVRALRRFWAVALLAALVSGFAAFWMVHQVSQTTYTANGLFIVPTAPEVEGGDADATPSTLPVSPYDAERLARTYALILVEDRQLFGELSDATGMPVADLVDGVVAESVPGSSAIRITYTSDQSAEVTAYFDTLSDLLVSTSLQNLPAGNVQPLSLPDADDVTEQADLAPVAPAIGLVVGLLIGIGGAVLLERLDSRIQSGGDLRTLVDWPVFELDDARRAARLETVVLRTLATGAALHEVAVAAARGTDAQRTVELAAELSHAEAALREAGRIPGRAPALQWRPVGVLATDGGAERGAIEAGAVVLLITRKARTRSVATAVQSLRDVLARDVVALLDSPHKDRPVGNRGAGGISGQPDAAADGSSAPGSSSGHAVPSRS